MRKLKLMKTLLVAAGLAVGASNAWADRVYFNDFTNGSGTSAPEGLTIHGDGTFVDDADTRFGKVFQNGGGAKRTHYLQLPNDVLSHSATTKKMTIGFWVNAKNAGESNSYMWAPIFTAYAAAPSNNTNTFPMFACQYRGVLQVNNSGWCDYVDAQNTNGRNTLYHDDSDWLADDGWHYYTAVFDGENAYVYFDGVLKNQWLATIDYNNGTNDITDTTQDGLFTAGSSLTYICLGGNQAWDWGDNDAAFMFDDFAVYDAALSAEQIAEVINDKLSYSWSAKAYATINGVKTQIDSWDGIKVLADNSYSVWAKRVIKYNDKFYELNDSKFFGSSVTFSTTMGNANVEYEINYTESDDIVYYTEGETFGRAEVSQTASGGAYCGYYAGPTTVTGLISGQTYRLETNVLARNTNSSLEVYPTGNTTSFGQIAKYHDLGYNTIYFTPTETSVRVGGPYYNDKFQNSLSFDYILIRKYDLASSGVQGDINRTSTWMQSDAYTLKKGETKVFSFKNHGYGVNSGNTGDVRETSWYNWRFNMYEGETSKAETRADFWDNKKNDNLGYQSVSKDGGSTKEYVDWTEFREDMDDATVVATLTYSEDGTYSIHAESTAAKSGYIYYIDHSVVDLTAAELTIKVSIEYSWLEMLSIENTAIGVTIPSSGYGSLASAYGLDFSGVDGLTAYVATKTTNTAVTLTSVDEIAANQGMILKGTSGSTYSIPVKAGAATPATNYLSAAVAATPIDANTAYILQGGQFHLVTADSTVPAGKAYLLASNVPAGARAMGFVFDESTGISSMDAVKGESSEFFNLKGQRVAAPQKGLYIVNGKKVIIK